MRKREREREREREDIENPFDVLLMSTEAMHFAKR